MNYRRHGIKALGLSILAVLGVMVFATPGAQTETGREWLINGKTLEELLINTEPIQGEVPGTGEGSEPAVTLLIPKLNAEILCKTGAFSSSNIAKIGRGEGLIVFSECFHGTRSPLELLSICTIANIHVAAKALSREHGGVIYIILEPQGGNFGVIEATGEECTLPPQAELTGKVAITIAAGSAATHLVVAATDTIELLLSAELKYGAHVARIHGDAKVFLIGTNVGKAFRLD